MRTATAAIALLLCVWLACVNARAIHHLKQQLTPHALLGLPTNAEAYYKYPSSTNGWTDSTGCRYNALQWGGRQGIGNDPNRNYHWGVCTIRGPPSKPDAQAVQYTFYHSSKGGAAHPMKWRMREKEAFDAAAKAWPHPAAEIEYVAQADAQPNRPLWMTVDLEQSVAIAAKDAVSAHAKKDKDVNVYTYKISIAYDQELKLFPLPPCVTGGRDVLNAYIKSEYPNRRKDLAFDGLHDFYTRWPAQLLYGGAPDPNHPLKGVLMGTSMDMKPHSGNGEVLRLMCDLFRTAESHRVLQRDIVDASPRGTVYDGWRSPWDQDEVMVCPHAIHKLIIPKADYAGAPRDRDGSGLTALYKCGPGVWWKKYAVVSTADGDSIVVHGRKEQYANKFYTAHGLPANDRAAAVGNAGATTLLPTLAHAGEVMPGPNPAFYRAPSPFPPQLRTRDLCPHDGDMFRYAFYLRTTSDWAQRTDKSPSAPASNAAGAAFADLTECQVVD